MIFYRILKVTWNIVLRIGQENKVLNYEWHREHNKMSYVLKTDPILIMLINISFQGPPVSHLLGTYYSLYGCVTWTCCCYKLNVHPKACIQQQVRCSYHGLNESLVKQRPGVILWYIQLQYPRWPILIALVRISHQLWWSLISAVIYVSLDVGRLRNIRQGWLMSLLIDTWPSEQVNNGFQS